ncbi:hypothetical protein [Clostridium psychrophilum]|uniref:hypothetical protein n=1 Tax=Clostridium psychrophilum TaxID=132926 RepID=UPI001C0C2F39|nr:hypothetical protein [Clostridium psychrophilum]MBU3179696.1 hypothetical protein [Clostridium psychrophilum]
MSEIDGDHKNYLNKAYKNFSELVYVVSAKELEFFITKGEFTSYFNDRMKKILSEINEEKNENLNVGVFFNTKGEITLIDAEIVGKYIEDNFSLKMMEYYKNTSLNKVIKEIVNGSEKSKEDFILISYSILYVTLNQLYKTVSCKKTSLIIYRNRYALEDYRKDDCTIVIAVLLILEDLCKYIGINRYRMVKGIKEKIYK